MTDVVRKLIEATKEYLRITDRATDANARVREAIDAVEREDKPEPPASESSNVNRILGWLSTSGATPIRSLKSKPDATEANASES